ncbi:MAG: hypothetical protein V8R56_07705 [Eubacterium sp.]
MSKEVLNPHYHLQQGTVQFDDEEYKIGFKLKAGLIYSIETKYP